MNELDTRDRPEYFAYDYAREEEFRSEVLESGQFRRHPFHKRPQIGDILVVYGTEDMSIGLLVTQWATDTWGLPDVYSPLWAIEGDHPFREAVSAYHDKDLHLTLGIGRQKIGVTVFKRDRNIVGRRSLITARKAIYQLDDENFREAQEEYKAAKVKPMILGETTGVPLAIGLLGSFVGLLGTDPNWPNLIKDAVPAAVGFGLSRYLCQEITRSNEDADFYRGVIAESLKSVDPRLGYRFENPLNL